MTVKDPNYGATASLAPTNVQVIAPATLEAGYTFDAMYEGVTFTVVVPSGGVSKGQRFIVPFTPPVTDAVAVAIPASSDSTSANGSSSKQQHSHSGGHGIPTGIWRDGLCDCCRFGPFHPHFICSWCFRPFLMGQIMTRMKMTWLGQRTRNGDSGNLNDSRIETDERWKNTFRNIVIVTLFFGTFVTVAAPNPELDPAVSDNTLDQSAYYNQLSDVDKARYTVNSWMSTLFCVYMFYILIQLRATIRYVYSIPEESCLFWYQLGLGGTNSRDGVCGSRDSKLCTAGVPIGWEDICCAIWCQLCIVGQMARHTVDYGEKKAVYCNSVGVMGWDDDEAYEGVEAGHVGEGSVLVV
mmetsp:Transcript_7454/g.16905  ORF Transcript_7454/g.16905 Transcript_7454/m.16905 type:complete len:353 (+) Transcript_7454:207-1265(+)|eukprot:CAMPEP_0172311208 /NCGR_PEP_ID=MMETSP1058-20130122/14191_1 /TAXON_ID=83371 /ORGANISM="Detonula confervacea, Strain CCMP 353" /LENGTH=352 /DNA_ID=CAMNT_0013024323 /DNA_START=127 /DNA_END=1185 /DNA_ORIENTATION=-